MSQISQPETQSPPEKAQLGLDPSLDAAVLEEIRGLLKRLKLNEEGYFRGLCRICLAWKLAPEHFRLLLVSAGIEASRASEIKRLLLNEKRARRFVSRELTWQEASADALKDVPGARERTVRRVLRLLLRHGHELTHATRVGDWVLDLDGFGQYRFSRPDATIKILRLVRCSEGGAK